jgi:hypothetical protein
MLRQRILVTALCGTLAVGVLAAAERMTLIQTNGEKATGLVVRHGSQGHNVIDDQFNVGRDDGTEFYIRFGDVAIIDFVGNGSAPPVSELSTLPEGGAHTMFLRNGSMRVGKFVNMVNGETVRWENKGGGTDDLPIRDVARIYLQTDAAWRLYNYTPPAASGAGGGRAVRNPAGRRGIFARGASNTVTVRGSVPWLDTGITVRRGDLVAFTTTGEVFIARNNDSRATPDGIASMMNRNYPVREMGAGGLVGKIGNTTFAIGSNQEPITMPAAGRLMLGINDDNFEDNSGSYRVVITRER